MDLLLKGDDRKAVIAMGLENCSKCNTLFVAVRGSLCPACQKAEEADLDKVVKFVKKNPKATIPEIVESTEVDEAVILKFVREKKLLLAGASAALNCEICRTAIQSGRFCAQCQGKLTQALNSSAPASKGGILEDSSEGRKRTRSTLILDKFHRR